MSAVDRHGAARPVRVRLATAADLDALQALEENTFTSDRISRRQWRHHLANPCATVLVSGAAGRVDAAAMALYRRNSRSARLYSLAVGAHARGTGLGGSLLAAIETDAQARGCTSIYLEVHVGNVIAITLYTRHGFVRTGRLAHFYEDGGDAWRYVKGLRASVDR
ncbi:MAG TPA: GNAT family N-acetyltransferase [Rhodanobacteraceae bacterium]